MRSFRFYFRYYRGRLPGKLLVLWYRLRGSPPSILRYRHETNELLLRAFGAKVDESAQVYPPVTLGAVSAKSGYRRLTLGRHVVLNGNNYLDLSGSITLEDRVSLGPGVIIMTHNAYNGNPFLEGAMPHTVGYGDVRVKRGSGIKAGALITQGVVIGEDVIVGGNAVVNRTVGDRCFVAGVPARLVKKL